MKDNQTKFKETELGIIPADWDILSLDSFLIKKNQGVNTTTEKVSYSESGIPVVRANNISAYKIDYDDLVYVDEVNYSRIRIECRPQNGDVLYTPIGSQFGSAALVKDNKDFGIAWNVMRMQPDNEKINSCFLEYLLNNPENRFRIRALNASSTMPFVSGVELGKTKFIIPTINEQKRIAEILSSLDDKLELNRKINANLEKLASTLFKQWFVDFEFPNENGKPYKSSGGKMIDSELGKIPDIFKIKKATSVLDFIKGVEPGNKNYYDSAEDGRISFYRVGDMFNGARSNIFVNKVDLNGIFCNCDDVLISTDGTVGRVVTGIDGSYSGGIRKVASLDKDIPNAYIYFWLKSQYVQDKLSEHAADATTIAHASGALKDFNMPYNKTMIDKFGIIVQPLFEQFQKNLREISLLSSLRDSLLPRLMSGKIRVKI